MLFFFKAGKFTYVSNTNTLRNDMATYYDFFSSKTIRNEPIISIPYVDAFGTGKKRYACSLQVYNVELLTYHRTPLSQLVQLIIVGKLKL